MKPSTKAKRAQLPPLAEGDIEDHVPLEFWTDHPKKPCRVDLTQFSEGRTNSVSPQWGGDFSGRPRLINELAPHIFVIFRASPEAVIQSLINNLRRWWRLFDNTQDLVPVTDVRDIGSFHEALQIKEALHAGVTNMFLRIVNARRIQLGLGKLFWMKRQASTSPTELIEHRHVKLVYEELKKGAWNALDRHKRAKGGTPQPSRVGPYAVFGSEPFLEEDLVATYEHFAAKVNHPCPSGRQLRELGIVNYEFAKNNCAQAIQAKFYTLPDVQMFFHLVVLLTGWNAETVLNIDVDDDPIVPHPGSDKFEVLRSVKTRGNSNQTAICQKKRELAPTNLIKELIRETESLRMHLKRELANVPRGDRSRKENLQRLVRSPWIYPTIDGTIRRLSLEEAKRVVGPNDGTRKGVLHSIARTINDRISDPTMKIPEGLNLRSLRDSFISYSYAESGYSWLMAKLAAGHADVNTLRRYLNRTHWSRHGKSKIRQLTSELWREIEERRVVDPAILFALVQRGEVSEEQRRRWLQHKDRTRVGVGCKDFRNPPRHLAPEHPEGSGCRAFRCTLCPHAVVFHDSLDHLARRKAEILSVQERIPLVSWEMSIYAEELESLDQTLDLFNPSEVLMHVERWVSEIERGAHLPRVQEGEYE